MPTVQVMVDGNSTPGSVMEALLETETVGHLDYQYFKHESHYDEYRAAVKAWFDEGYSRLDGVWLEGLEVPEEEDDEWDCYAYFVIEEVNQHLEEALKNNPNNCPYCNSDDLSTSILDGNIDIKVVCESCKEEWVEHYQLAGVTLNE